MSPVTPPGPTRMFVSVMSAWLSPAGSAQIVYVTGVERAGRFGGGGQPRQDPGEPRAQVADGIQHARTAQHRGGAAHVPVEGAVAGAVEQALQGQAGAGGQGPDLRRELAGDGLAFRGLAREDGYQPGQARAAGGVGAWLDGGP